MNAILSAPSAHADGADPKRTVTDQVRLLAQIETAFAFAQRQVRQLIDRDPGFCPLYTDGGKWRHAKPPWTPWCDGFLSGMMWVFFAKTKDPQWGVGGEK